MVINNFAMLYDVGKINSALIIAPKGVYQELGRRRTAKAFT
jgi:hypothetical protein